MGRLLGSLATLIGVVAVVLAVTWLLRSDSEAAPEAGPRPFVLPVTLAVAEQGEVRPRALLTGTVRAPDRARLAFATLGILEELNVRDVDRFERDDVLARVNSRVQELLVAAAEADLALAQRELEKLEAGTRDEVKQRLKAELEVRAAEEALAAADVERGLKLAEDNHVSAAELDRLDALHRAAIARRKAAAEILAEAEAGTRPEDIAIAQAKVAADRARVDQARIELAKTELRSLAPGVVLRRLAAVGDYLPTGTPVLEVIDPTQLEIDVEIPGRFAAKLGQHPQVIVTVDELDGLQFDTVLDARVPAADERSGNSRGVIRPSADDSRVAGLEAGMFVRVELRLDPRVGCVVPSDAVLATDAGTIVVIARRSDTEGGPVTAELVPVRVLATDGSRSAVEGLGGPVLPGDEVVVTGVDLAFPGATLLPRERPGESRAPGAPGAPAPGEGPAETPGGGSEKSAHGGGERGTGSGAGEGSDDTPEEGE